MIDEGFAGGGALDFLRKNDYLLTGAESKSKIIAILQRIRDEREQTINTYLASDDGEKKIPMYKEAYKTAVKQLRKVDDLLHKLQ